MPLPDRSPERPWVHYEGPPPSPPLPVPPGPLRPVSQHWMRRTAWIDGALGEPQFYYDHDEIHAAQQAARVASAENLLALQQARPQTPPHGPGAPSNSAIAANAPSPSPSPARTPSPPIIVHSSPSPPPAAPASGHHPDVAPHNAAPTATSGPAGAPAPEYLINVTMRYTDITKGPVGRGSKLQSKKAQVTKMVRAPLLGMTRARFVRTFLDAHELGDHYAAGPYHGPQFKLWWQGVAKSAAGTIDSDGEFAVGLTAILAKRGCSNVSIEFTREDLEPYRVLKRAYAPPDALIGEGEEELLHGTKVPRIDAYPDETQLHGGLILELKRLHQCRIHPNEHNDIGYCYKPEGFSADAHVRLNNRRLKRWAAAIASSDATKWHPPNCDEFDGIRRGQTSEMKARGRSGPRSVSSPFPSPSPSMTSDPSHTLLLGLMPIMTALASQQLVSSQAGGAYSHINPPHTPHRSGVRAFPLSPVPSRAEELHQFLLALHAKKDVDLLGCEGALAALEYTPDIIPQIPIARLCEVTGAVEGRLVKLQVFAKEWTDRLEEKRRSLD